MSIFARVLHFLRAAFKTFRLALPKLGLGWMFALLTINFNRITIVELQVTAVAVTAMLAMHHFLSPLQVVCGRIADRHPIFGYRRTPYFLVGSVLAGLLFLGLPRIAFAMGEGLPWALPAGFGLILLFGVAIAMIGDTHHSLIAEVTTPRARGAVISVVWTFTILSTIIAAGIMNEVMGDDTSLAAMQRLYNLTPFIVIGTAVLGIIGIEKRLTGDELKTAIAQSEEIASGVNPVKAAVNVLRSNPQAWGFFAFIFVSILAIFLQDTILEPFGAEVFGMELSETSRFQPTWGGGVLIGMIIMGVVSAVFNVPKRTIALIGCVGTAAGMALLTWSAYAQQESLVLSALVMMGLFTGFFNVGALSMMMDMTIEGATGLYMGIWGMAQAFGTGLASIGGGALHTGLIGTELLSAHLAYTVIFSIEAVGMLIAAVILAQLSVQRFHDVHEAGVTRTDTLRALEAATA